MTVSDYLPYNTSESLTFKIALFLISVITGYHVILAMWNISPLHPLSRIPGLADTRGKSGKCMIYMVLVVRINPNEVHCADSFFAAEIYGVGARKRNKPQHQVSGSMMEHSIFATIDHDLHRLRRRPLAKFFSQAQFAKVESLIQSLVQRLCDKLLKESECPNPLDITAAYSCFTSDVVADYRFGEPFGFVAQEVHIFRFFPALKHIALAASRLSSYVSSDMELLIKQLRIDILNKIKNIQTSRNTGNLLGRANLFGSLLDSKLPDYEKSLVRLTDEAAAFLGGGTETVSWTVSVITYHLLSKPDILEQLTQELKTTINIAEDLPRWTALQKLPFLSAVIQEGLRLSYGISARTSRVLAEEDHRYQGSWTPSHGTRNPVYFDVLIPRGYAIGMSSAISHHDERNWPESHSFLPQRWMSKNLERKKDLESHILSFSKGSRACIGRNLATCELYLLVTALILRVFPRMHLFETEQQDIEYDHDMIIPLTHSDSKGVRVLID
ncbi:uncharacterized protein EAE97_009852 [Botrytis byssoidea]|uniref:Cytochrome P450 n=1 Tax=Botrytis byssoidea TaxID=139641 RepID=A0A9P5I0A2_9HELO|nr:uncharacterized protein EAE97_009852 [Botrytis byssoidea]KAF7928054.1 hypothetical protein EAE97_009852 [Botrytis byssoidea]